MEQTEVSISEKEKAARLIKEMREQGLLRDGSFGKLALPTTEEADTMTRRSSWFAPDAVVLAPPSSICPHFGVLAVNSFVIPEDEESQRRVSLESGMETERRAHFTESVTSEEEVQGPPPPLEQAKPAQRDLEWDSSEDDKRMAHVSIPPPVGTTRDKKHLFVWVNINVALLDAMDEMQVMNAIGKRNKGETAGVPEWLTEGLKELKGPVDWLLKVKVPAGTRRGQRLVLMCNGVKVKTTYNGHRSEGEHSVFAVQERDVKPSLGQRIGKSLAAAIRSKSR